MMEDKINIKLQIDKNDKGYNILECYVEINNTPVNMYTEFTEFLLTSKDNRDCYTKTYHTNHKQVKYSFFEPFTCSCGIAGCVGIYEGIHTKYRKNSLEWRVPKNSGYDHILDKTFYSFNKLDYLKEIDNLWKFLEDNKDILVYDENNDGYWDEDSEDWVDEVNLVKLSEMYKWLYEEVT